jgi:Protein of unknown function (DUF1236)
MTKSAARILAIAIWAFGTAAQAQAPAAPAPEPTLPTAKLNLTLEQRHVIKELVKDMKIEPAESSARAIGDNLPQDAALRPVPGDISRKVPQIRTHRFLYTADRILIVDPKDNRVAEVIELKAD